MINHANDDDIIIMKMADADRTSGGLSRWNEEVAITLTPTAHTWDKGSAGRLSFTVDVPKSGNYDLGTALETAGRVCWFWVEIDRRKDLVGQKSLGRLWHQTNFYTWSHGGGFNTVYLSAGLHSIDIISISSDYRLHTLALVPTGEEYPAITEESITSGAPPITRNNSFPEWLEDETRNGKRVLLVELDHSKGTIRLGSLPWLSDDNYAYDDWLVNSSAYIEQVDDSAIDLGSIEAVNLDADNNWLVNDFRGHKARFYYGDEDWTRSQFKQIASATIESCRPIQNGVFRFDLVSESEKYNRTFHEGEDITEVITLENAVPWLLDQFEGSEGYEFLNIGPIELNTVFKFTVSESTTMDSLLYLFADSMGAILRRAAGGHLQFIVPDIENPPALDITGHSIVGDLSVSESILPVARIVVNYNDGESSLKVNTGAQIGSFDDEVIIDTVLVKESDAQALAERLAPRYSKTVNQWNVDTVQLDNILQIGDVVTINDSGLIASGVVSTIRQTPLSSIGQIKVAI